MTVLMKNTEEKWLLELYGIEYANYCKRVRSYDRAVCLSFGEPQRKGEFQWIKT